jgi:hypothetical protein
MKSAELEGAQLDYWVARALGYASLSEIPSEVTGSEYHPHEPGCELRDEWSPSTDWSQGGQIIERNIAQLEHGSNDPGLAWNATNDNGDVYWADTALVAAMRAYVASKFGDKVPDSTK